jgi:hypothetical protein
MFLEGCQSQLLVQADDRVRLGAKQFEKTRNSSIGSFRPFPPFSRVVDGVRPDKILIIISATGHLDVGGFIEAVRIYRTNLCNDTPCDSALASERSRSYGDILAIDPTDAWIDNSVDRLLPSEYQTAYHGRESVIASVIENVDREGINVQKAGYHSRL